MLPKFLTKTKLALLFAIFFLLFTISSKPIHAFAPDTDYFQFEQAVFNTQEMNLESFVFSTFNSLQYTLTAKVFGCISCREGKNIFSERPDGAASALAFLIATPYSAPPASGIEYLAYLGRQISPAQPVYAQGTGFKEMLLILPIWKTFRDVSYVFFVLIFIFIGFAIMFRVKISPQAVLTIQSALPRIVMALILITFSYAIVGFLIDVTWVINNLILFTFAKMEGLPPLMDRMLTLGGVTTSGGWLFLKMFVFSVPAAILSLLTVLLLSIPIIVGAALATVWAGGAGGAAAGIAAGIIALLFAILLLIALLRTFWTLLKAYTNIILSLIFAPFIMLIGVMPGSNAISSWFRNLIANLAVLPTVLTMVIVSSYLTYRIWATHWPDIFLGNIPVIGILIEHFRGVPIEEQMQILILIFVSMMILLMTPKASDMIQAFLAGKPFGYGAAIGEAMGPITKPAGFLWETGKKGAVSFGGEWVKYGLGSVIGGAPTKERKTEEAERAAAGTPPSV